jgi:hypothetical protein
LIGKRSLAAQIDRDDVFGLRILETGDNAFSEMTRGWRFVVSRRSGDARCRQNRLSRKIRLGRQIGYPLAPRIPDDERRRLL